MGWKNVTSFLLLKPVMTKRNLISILLVMIFFLIYIVSGGQISSVSKLQQQNINGFGAQGAVTGDILGEEQAVEISTQQEGNTANLYEQYQHQQVERPAEIPARRQAAPSTGYSEDADELSRIENRLKALQ